MTPELQKRMEKEMEVPTRVRKLSLNEWYMRLKTEEAEAFNRLYYRIGPETIEVESWK